MKRLLAVAASFIFTFASQGAEPDNLAFAHQYMQCKKIWGDLTSCEDNMAYRFCTSFEKLPPNIQNKIGLELHCNFLAGEISGDNSVRDKEIATASAICEGSDAQSMDLLRTYWEKQEEMHALLFFTSDYLTMDAQCAGKGGHD